MSAYIMIMMPHVGPMIRQYNIFYSIYTLYHCLGIYNMI